MKTFKNLSKAVPPRARLMIIITFAVLVVATMGILNMVGGDEAQTRPAERGEVQVNLSPSEEQIGRTRPGDVTILPPDSEIARTIEQENKRAIEEALKNDDISLTQSIKIPDQPRPDETPARNSSGPSPEELDKNAIQALLEERRQAGQRRKEEPAVVQTGGGSSNNQEAFNPEVFMKKEIDRAQGQGDSLGVAVDAIAAREASVRPQGSANLSNNARKSSASATGQADSSRSVSSGSADLSVEANEYLNDFQRETKPSRVATTVADRLSLYRQAMSSAKGSPTSQIDPTSLAPLLGGESASSTDPFAGESSQSTSASGQGQRPAGPMIEAGTILYAVLDTEVNSDSTTHIRATIVQEGPYKNGHALGQISLKGDRLLLTFNVIGHKGRDVPVSAVAVDPETAQTALADKVDRHLLERYGLFWGAAFMEGFANALSNTTTVINSDGSQTTSQAAVPDTEDQMIVATGKVGERMVPLLAQRFNRKPTVYLAAGRPIGLMLLKGLPY